MPDLKSADDLKCLLDTFIASENFEERVDLKKRTIDAPVLAHLRGQA